MEFFPMSINLAVYKRILRTHGKTAADEARNSGIVPPEFASSPSCAAPLSEAEPLATPTAQTTTPPNVPTPTAASTPPKPVRRTVAGLTELQRRFLLLARAVQNELGNTVPIEVIRQIREQLFWDGNFWRAMRDLKHRGLVCWKGPEGQEQFDFQGVPMVPERSDVLLAKQILHPTLYPAQKDWTKENEGGDDAW